MVMHLLGFSGFVFPLANIAAPLILWLAKRNESENVDRVGREVLNFQISYTIYLIVGVILAPVLIGLLVLPVVSILWIVFMVLAATKASKGERFAYPLTIKFLQIKLLPPVTKAVEGTAPLIVDEKARSQDDPSRARHDKSVPASVPLAVATAAVTPQNFLAASEKKASEIGQQQKPSEAAMPLIDSDDADLGPDDWVMKPKEVAYWRHFLGGSMLQSYRLVFASRRGNNFIARLANGKELRASIDSVECTVKCSGGSNSIEYMTMKCRAGSRDTLKFAVNDLQMPEEWWNDLKEKLQCKKVTSLTEKFEKVATRAVIGLFVVTCPKCKVQGEASSEEVDKRCLGQKTQKTGYGEQSTTYNIYQITTNHQCGACGHSWVSKREKREYSSGSRGFGMDAVN